MDLSTYEDLSGTTVKDSQQTRVTAYIDRTRIILESLLGYTLDPDRTVQNLYTEIGKTQASETFAFDWFDNNPPTDLLPPDDAEGAYRLFSYDVRDQYVALDPFSAIHSLKLVRNGITYYTFDANSYRVQVARDGLTRFLVISPWLTGWRLRWLTAWQENGLQFAADADWLWAQQGDNDQIPDRLLYLWADMVTFYSNAKNNIKSETTGSHNYSKFAYTPPETLPANAQVLQELAGPYGVVGKVPIA